MALRNDFYQEIREKEQFWIDKIEKNLLNIYYFESELIPFYNKKIEELTYEYSITSNKIIGQIIEELNCIITKLNELSDNYRRGKQINSSELITLFLINKFDNNVNLKEQKTQKRKQVLESLREDYKNLGYIFVQDNKLSEDYFDDDFVELKTK